jgi:hypothetical protein
MEQTGEDPEYTLQDYLNGKELPVEVKPIPMVTWTCGVLRGRGGTFRAFWTRTSLLNEFVVASTIVVTRQNNSKAVRQTAEDMLQSYLADPPPFSLVDDADPVLVPVVEGLLLSTPVTLGAGSICTHNDGTSHHMAVVVDVVGEMAHALFLTTNPRWNYYARLATPAEATLLGQRSERPSYLAPVVRPVREFYRSTGETPVEDYQREFARAFASGWV